MKGGNIIANMCLLFACGEFGHGVAFKGEFIEELHDSLAQKRNGFGWEKVGDGEITISVEFVDVNA